MSHFVVREIRHIELPLDSRTRSYSISINTTNWLVLSKVSAFRSHPCCIFTYYNILDMQRFQKPYNLKAIPEVQAFLNVAFENSKHHGDLQDLYRRRYDLNVRLCLSFLMQCISACWSNRGNQPTHLLQATCGISSAGQPAPRLQHSLFFSFWHWATLRFRTLASYWYSLHSLSHLHILFAMSVCTEHIWNIF
jgi:hypothetical protein